MQGKKIEIDEDFVRDCEQAIIDRDQKIQTLLSQLSEQKPRSPDPQILEKIEEGFSSTGKELGNLRDWLKGFEEDRLRRLEMKNEDLIRENAVLRDRNEGGRESEAQTKLKAKGLALSLKKELGRFREGLEEFKRQETCKLAEIKHMIERERNEVESRIRKLRMNGGKLPSKKHGDIGLRASETEDFRTSVSMERKSKNISENSQNAKELRSILKDEHERKSTIIQCIFKSLNQDALLQNLPTTKKNESTKKTTREMAVSTEQTPSRTRKAMDSRTSTLPTTPDFLLEKVFPCNECKHKERRNMVSLFSRSVIEKPLPSSLLYNKCLTQKSVDSL